MTEKIIASILILFIGIWTIYSLYYQYKKEWCLVDKIGCWLIGVVSSIGSIIIWL
jgi:putative Mn2+ efflux pump MntP